MILFDKTVYVFRCERCLAAFIMDHPDEEYGGNKQWELLIANPCRVCSKGRIEYLGEFFGRQTVVESSR